MIKMEIGSVKEPENALACLFEELNSSSENFLHTLINFTNHLLLSDSKISEDYIEQIFRFSIIKCNEYQDAESALTFYKNWFQYSLTFKNNPFLKEPIIIPTILEDNKEALNINRLMNKYWFDDFNTNSNYLKAVEETAESNDKELFKFLLNNNYQAKINENKFVSETNSERLQIIQLLFNQLYYDGFSDAALSLLNLFPKTWKTFWNAHLCDNTDNEYLKALIYLLENEKTFMENQNILCIQLKIKELLNHIDTAFQDYSKLDSNIIKKVNKELEQELKNLKKFDEDEAVELFTKKLFKFLIFDKAVEILNNIPKKTSKEHRVAIYIDLKQIFEACIENNIIEAEQELGKINRTLFEELKDKTSGTSLIIQMLNNKNQKGLSQYIKQISYILDPNSMEMESLFESLILFFSKKEIQKRQLSVYINSFEKLEPIQFKILNEILITFNKDENNIVNATKLICSNLDIFKEHSHTFYILLDSFFNRKFSLETHQKFISILLGSDLNNILSRNFLYLLVDHFYEQPYRDFKKNFPHSTLNFNLIKRLVLLLEETKVAYMRDKNSILEYEDKKFAVEKARDFLFFLLGKTHTIDKGEESVCEY